VARQFLQETAVGNVPHENAPVGAGTSGDVTSVRTPDTLGPGLRRLELGVTQGVNGGTGANVHNLEARIHGVRQHLCSIGRVELYRGDTAFVNGCNAMQRQGKMIMSERSLPNVCFLVR
jgi:hypothetical protein